MPPVTLFIVFITRTSISLARRGFPTAGSRGRAFTLHDIQLMLYTCVHGADEEGTLQVSLLYNSVCLLPGGRSHRGVSGFDVSSLKLQILSQILWDSEKLVQRCPCGFSKYTQCFLVFPSLHWTHLSPSSWQGSCSLILPTAIFFL